MYVLTMKKKNEDILYCTGYFSGKGKGQDKPDVHLYWRKADQMPCIPVSFQSERSAWWYFYNARNNRPEEYKGYYASVEEYEQ